MPGFQTPVTIANIVDRINNNKLLLPSFQRKFVWKANQIENLFDSLMQGYPISSMLWWRVEGEAKADYKFYSFLRSYIQNKKTYGERRSMAEHRPIVDHREPENQSAREPKGTNG